MDRHGWFYKKIDKVNGCWLWKGFIIAGYPQTRINGRIVMAARVSMEIKLNEPIPTHVFVVNTCGNKACVNPDHLTLALQSHLNERKPNPDIKLDWERVREMRSAFDAKTATKAQLAAKYGVSKHTVDDVVKRRSWKE